MVTKKRIKAESDKAIQMCGYECVVCGWNRKNNKGETLLVGAHVKPFENVNTDTYKDIIALCPNCHIEFDNYMFYISLDGKYKVITDKNNAETLIPLHKRISYVDKEYFAYRMYLYKENENN